MLAIFSTHWIDMDTWFWIVGGFLSVVTVFGNGVIVFLVIKNPRLRGTKTNAFVISLALADICVGTTLVPLSYIYDVKEISNVAWVSSLRWLFNYASVLNICALAFDRYLAVVKPYKYITRVTRRRVNLLISACWLIPFMVITVPLFVHGVSTIHKGKHKHESTLERVRISTAFVLFEVLPIPFMVYCLVNLLLATHKHKKHAKLINKQLCYNHTCVREIHQRATLGAIAVSITVFLVTMVSLLRCSVKVLFLDQVCGDKSYKIPLLLANSAFNPFAYSFMKTDIKTELYKTFRKTIPTDV